MGTENRYKVVGEAKNGVELIGKTSRLNPDVVPIDIGLPIINGIEATKAIKRLGRSIQLVCEDFTNREVGEQLDISKRTIEGHRERIMKKMNVKSGTGLVAHAYANNLIKCDTNLTSNGVCE